MEKGSAKSVQAIAEVDLADSATPVDAELEAVLAQWWRNLTKSEFVPSIPLLGLFPGFGGPNVCGESLMIVNMEERAAKRAILGSYP